MQDRIYVYQQVFDEDNTFKFEINIVQYNIFIINNLVKQI